MLPHLRGRPGDDGALSRRHRRRRASCRRTSSKGFPAWLERVEVPKKGGVVHYPLVDDARSLLWLANQNCITPHVWTSRAPDLYHPDLCVFDLDPSRGRPDGAARGGARPCATCCDELGLRELGQDVGLEGLSHRRAARRQRATSARSARFAARGRRACSSRATRAPDAGVQQGRSRRPHPRRHRAQRLRRDVRGGLRRAREARRAGVRAVHLGGGRERRRPPQTFTLRTMASASTAWRPVA